MTMRLSGLSSYYLFSRSLQLRNSELFRSSEQLSSQKRINRPSDDPEGMKIVMNHRGTLDKITQYQNNILLGKQFLDHTETSLSQAKEVIARAKEIAQQGNNTSLSNDAKQALAREVEQLGEQLLALSNTRINGEYLFSGFKTDTKPFTLDANYPSPPTATFHGDTNTKPVLIGEDNTVTIQARGDQAFLGDGTASSVDLFEVLGTLQTTLETNIDPNATVGDPDHIDTIIAAMGDAIENLDLGFNQVVREIASIGGRSKRLENARDDYGVEVETLKAFISDIEDKDVGEIAMEFQKAQIALQATLGSATAVLGLPSLMDFVGR